MVCSRFSGKYVARVFRPATFSIVFASEYSQGHRTAIATGLFSINYAHWNIILLLSVRRMARGIICRLPAKHSCQS